MGTLAPFGGGADDLLRRFAGVRASESMARRATEDAGRRFAKRQRGGDVVTPVVPREWDFSVEGHAHTAAYLGRDAFSVPMQAPVARRWAGC